MLASHPNETYRQPSISKQLPELAIIPDIAIPEISSSNSFALRLQTSWHVGPKNILELHLVPGRQPSLLALGVHSLLRGIAQMPFVPAFALVPSRA
mmetsp:Transcript_116660/g.183468  ORF Transcript_116660/g.183468 Transcript_116660/m.183468 type:complete len:96 (-) Transcript_116660:77-364(-)